MRLGESGHQKIKWGRRNKEKMGDYREEMQSPWGGNLRSWVECVI